jgi:hypothetical protein
MNIKNPKKPKAKALTTEDTEDHRGKAKARRTSNTFGEKQSRKTEKKNLPQRSLRKTRKCLVKKRLWPFAFPLCHLCGECLSAFPPKKPL